MSSPAHFRLLRDIDPERDHVSAARLCGIGDTVSLLMAEHAFPAEPTAASIARIGVPIGSVLSAPLEVGFVLLNSSIAVRTETTGGGHDVELE